jgi:SAM-dependent methyltransferase
VSTTQTAEYPWRQLLPQLGTADEFAEARHLFEAAGYNAEVLAAAGEADPAAMLAGAPETGLDALVRLFHHQLRVETAALERLLPGEGLRALWSLGLLAECGEHPGFAYAAATVVEVRGFIMACDRSRTPDGGSCPLPADVVYPANIKNTGEFLRFMPRGPCEAMLELGTGAGIAAMVGAGDANHVWATDVTARAVRFADFNRRLAGLTNMTLVEGDMYAPVEGLTFDRIAIHPPYVPARQSKFAFREGGEDGEQIMRRAVEGLPRFLRPGGVFYARLLASDREGESFESRVRRWLGEGEQEFDLVLASDNLLSPADYIAYSISRKQADAGEVAYWRELWDATRTEALFYGSVLIRRHADAARAVTWRTQAGVGFSGPHLAWLLESQTAMAQPGAEERLLGSRPSISPECRLRVLYSARDGRFSPGEFKFEVMTPFKSLCQVDAFVAGIVSDCDGNTTWREHFDRAAAAGAVPPEGTPELFARFLPPLVGNGVLRISEWSMPEFGRAP